MVLIKNRSGRVEEKGELGRSKGWGSRIRFSLELSNPLWQLLKCSLTPNRVARNHRKCPDFPFNGSSRVVRGLLPEKERETARAVCSGLLAEASAGVGCVSILFCFWPELWHGANASQIFHVLNKDESKVSPALLLFSFLLLGSFGTLTIYN